MFLCFVLQTKFSIYLYYYYYYYLVFCFLWEIILLATSCWSNHNSYLFCSFGGNDLMRIVGPIRNPFKRLMSSRTFIGLGFLPTSRVNCKKREEENKNLVNSINKQTKQLIFLKF